MSGTFTYCVVNGAGACDSDLGVGYELVLDDEAMVIRYPEGGEIGRANDAPGIWAKRLFSDAPNGPGFADTLGPSLSQAELTGRLVLATSLLSEGGGAPVVLDTTIAALRIERRGDETSMDVRLDREETEGDFQKLRFFHPDGIWPPQRIGFEARQAGDVISQNLARTSQEDVEPGFRLPMPRWDVGVAPVKRVPTVPAEFGFSKDFAVVLQDASLHPSVMTYMEEHPDWTIPFARITRLGELGIETQQQYHFTMTEGCALLTIRMNYVAANIPQFVQVTEARECSDEVVPLDELADYRMSAAMTVLDLVERFGFGDQRPGSVEYRAPDATESGPLTKDGFKTSFGGGWSVAYAEPITYNGETHTWTRTFGVSGYPGEQLGIHSVTP